MFNREKQQQKNMENPVFEKINFAVIQKLILLIVEAH